MATHHKLMQPTIPKSHSLEQLLSKTRTQLTPFSSPNPRPIYPKPIYPRVKQTTPSGFKPNHSLSLRVAAGSEEQGSGLLHNDTGSLTKASIYQTLEGINRGVFGVTSEKKKEIENLVILLESHNPTLNPTQNLEKIIDVAQGKAVNVIKFNARGLRLLNGQLTIQASFSVASPSRVNIEYDSSTITPDQLMNLFEKNYELLLSIFNPDGWLEITYVDEEMRIGRDDKGNIFILERATDHGQT